MAIDREKVLAAAQKYVEKKKYDRAVLEYQRIIQEDPNDARTLLKMGDLQSKMEAYGDAIASYERVGRFYASQGFSLKAIAVYKQIREIIARHVPQLEDKYGHITPMLAELYQQLGLTSDALATLDEVATRLQRQGRNQDALGVFRKIVELDPTNPLPHLRLAEAFSQAKDTDGAIAEFGTAASQLLKLGRRDDALKVLERLLHHKADAAHARMAAEAYLGRGGPNDGMQALAKLQICFQANPRDLETLTLLARAFTHIGQAAKAIEVQKEMARIARDSGRADLFRELVTKLVKLAPNDEGVRQLAASSVAPGPVSSIPPRTATSAPPATARSTSADDEGSYEDVGDGDFEAEEQPIDLRRPMAQTEPEAEIVVESMVDVEELGEPPSAGALEQVARILGEAATFRRSRIYTKAIETLRGGLKIAPRSLEVHEMLRDVLLEAGHSREAAAELVQIAGLLVESLDGDAAARALQEALALDPNNGKAADMLHELGYELVEEAQAQSASEPASSDVPAPRPTQGSYDPEAPLPAYDLDEANADDASIRTDIDREYRHAMQTSRGDSDPDVRAARQPAHTIDEMDDPFGDAPLPSFPLEAPTATESAFDLVGGAPEPASGTNARDTHADTGATSQPSAPPPRRRASSVPPALELESALEEAEFFASRGLFEDARAILEEQLARLPNHPLLLERMTELDAQERSLVGGSGTRPSPAAVAAEDDRAFDIAESLGALEEDRVSGVGPGTGSAALSEQVDVEEVFAKFKAGVAQQISVDDAQSHYDLGVAYKEMGLLDDAIREFDVAGRDPKRECVCHSMVGMIQLERGNLNEAIDAFTRGLRSQERSKDQESALCYEIGAAYEAKKMIKQALEHFLRTARLTPAYRDVQERVRRLQKVEPKPVRAVAVGADDEFDRAFDDILSGKTRQ